MASSSRQEAPQSIMLVLTVCLCRIDSCQGALFRVIMQEQHQQQKAARGSRVVLYHCYREGELPDIQIKYCDV